MAVAERFLPALSHPDVAPANFITGGVPWEREVLNLRTLSSRLITSDDLCRIPSCYPDGIERLYE